MCVYKYILPPVSVAKIIMFIEYLSKVSKGVCDIDCTLGVEIITTTICHECKTVSSVAKNNYNLMVQAHVCTVHIYTTCMYIHKDHTCNVLFFVYVQSSSVSLLQYGTVQLQLHFYTRVHAWQHAVFRVCIA